MRRTSWLLALGLSIPVFGTAGVAGCTVSRPVTVIRLGPGESAEPIRGDVVKTARGSQEPFVGLRGGYHVVRNEDDWQAAWPAIAATPKFPETLDTARSMLLLAVADQKDTIDIKIGKVIETGDAVHVWVKDTKVGKNCSPKVEQNPFDAVITARIDKPIKVHVDESPAESCGDPPAVTINCRVNDGDAWTPKVSAQPGDTIECAMSAQTRGKFALIDNVLSLGELPGGSTSKLAYTRNSARGAFTIDVFGAYTARAESKDEAGRKTVAVANIDAAPPKTKDVLVQVVWSNFDASDDPATFPRVRLNATLETRDAKDKPVSKECSADSPAPEACEVKVRGVNTHMTLKASSAKIPLEVFYVDDRIDQGPLVCVQVYFDGTRTGETCDRKARTAEERWPIGTLEMETGKLLDAPPAAASGKGGAAVSGDVDAGAKAAAPAHKGPKKPASRK